MIMGFREDVSIRIKADGEDSRVDIRSSSRYFESDLGSNAARLLGKKPSDAVAEVKRTSPSSKVILICSSQRHPGELRKCGADACLREEALVEQLPSVVRKFLSQGDWPLSNTERRDPVRVSDRGERQKGRLNEEISNRNNNPFPVSR